MLKPILLVALVMAVVTIRPALLSAQSPDSLQQYQVNPTADTVAVRIVDEGAGRWQVAMNIVVIAGVLVAFASYWWNRRQKRIENTIDIAERQIYDSTFAEASWLLEVALQNPSFMSSTPFHLPRKYRDAVILILGQYKTVLERINEKLIDKTLYQKIMGFRLERERSLLQPYITGIRAEEDNPNWGAEIMDLLTYEGDDTDTVLAKGAGWIRSQRFLIRNMSARSIVRFLELRSVDMRAPSGTTHHWFARDWKPAPRDVKTAWVKKRKEQLREEIVSSCPKTREALCHKRKRRIRGSDSHLGRVG